MEPVSYKGSGGKYVRGKQINENATHVFIVRFSAVASLGKTYNSGFASGFDSIVDLSPLKSDYFLFVQKGSTVKGRLFRIHEVINVSEADEQLMIAAEEVEERGTGYPV